jgi:hypothetical protein
MNLRMLRLTLGTGRAIVYWVLEAPKRERVWPTMRETSSTTRRPHPRSLPQLGCQQMPAAEDVEPQIAVTVMIAVEESPPPGCCAPDHRSHQGRG